MKPPEVTQITVVHGWQLLTWNLWVVIGLVIYLALVAAAVVTWRKRPRRKVPLVTVEKSPIDALLARADAVLRGGTLVGSGLSGQDDTSSGGGQSNASWTSDSTAEIRGAGQAATAANGEVNGSRPTTGEADAGASSATRAP